LVVEELIAPLCIRKDATQITPLMLEVQKKLHIFGRSGALFFWILPARLPMHRLAGFWAVVLLM
jgi:hypothetical protein